MTVDRVTRIRNHFAKLVDRITDNVHHAAERGTAHRDGDRTTEVDHLHPADHAVGRKHRDRADATLPEMLLHFGDDVDLRFYVKTFRCDS